MRYLVTGAAGFIGSHLSERLTRDGHDVLSVDLDYADLSDYPIEPLITGADGIFHLAGQPGVRNSWGIGFESYLRHNVLVTQRLFEKAAELGVRVVYASSSSVYGDAETFPTPETADPKPVSPYGISKLACEHLARAIGVDAVGLRYFTVYGPRQRPDMAFSQIFRALADNTLFRLFGNASRSFTYVDDAVDATVRAMTLGGEPVYNIGGSQPTSMIDAIAAAEWVSGRTLDLELLPPARGDARVTSADSSLAEKDLGWKPTTGLMDGMRAQWEAVTVCV